MAENYPWLHGNWCVSELGIIRPRHQNDVVLMKNLPKFFTKADLPWVKLI
jgi:hypothetical protein